MRIRLVLLAARDTLRVALPIAELRGLKVSRGVRRSPWAGAVAGAAFGWAVGFVAGFPHSFFVEEDAHRWTRYMSRGLLIGGTVGLVIGASVGTERWEDVPLRTLRDLRVGAAGASVDRVETAEGGY